MMAPGLRLGARMRSLKSAFGAIGTLIAVLNFGGLFYYCLKQSGSLEQAQADGLGPTLMGLGAFGLFFSFLLIVQIVRLFAGRRPPGSGGRGGADTPAQGGEGKFDADAVVARYMAQRRAEGDSDSPAAPTALGSGGPAKRPGFGRKNR